MFSVCLGFFFCVVIHLSLCNTCVGVTPSLKSEANRKMTENCILSNGQQRATPLVAKRKPTVYKSMRK